MAKRLRVRDRLLLGLAIAGDLYFEIFEPYGVQLKKLKGFLPPDYKVTNFTNAVSRLLRTQQIEKVIKNGEPYLRLSSPGRRGLTRDFSFLRLSGKPWDHLWRIVFYDIPEKEKRIRVVLREKLLELGLGQLQESVFISPFDLAEDLREFILAHNLEDQVFVSVSRRLLAGNEKILANKVWRLSQLNEEYQAWLEKLANRRQDFYSLYLAYIEILENDPCLPKELLPEDWLGEKVRKEAKRITAFLLK